MASWLICDDAILPWLMSTVESRKADSRSPETEAAALQQETISNRQRKSAEKISRGNRNAATRLNEACRPVGVKGDVEEIKRQGFLEGPCSKQPTEAFSGVLWPESLTTNASFMAWGDWAEVRQRPGRTRKDQPPTKSSGV